jgi:spermidine synthase
VLSSALSETSSRKSPLPLYVQTLISRYQEMIAHIPIASHPDPKTVLVVGGGDGGVIREALKHKSVEKVTLVDIDEVH